MSSPPSSGSDQNTPAPPQQPGVPLPQPDRGAGLALAGFLVSLAAFIAALVGILVGLFGYDGVPGVSSGEGVLLIEAAYWVALVGLPLSFLGRHSSSRRWLAIAGMVLSVLVLVLLLLATAWVGILADCSHNQATGSCI